MAFEDGTIVVATQTGPSDHIYLKPGDHILLVSYDGAGDSELEVSGDGVTFVPARDQNGPVVIPEDWSCQIAGGVFYRLQVNAVGTSVTFSAHLCVPRSRTAYTGR